MICFPSVNIFGKVLNELKSERLVQYQITNINVLFQIFENEN